MQTALIVRQQIICAKQDTTLNDCESEITLTEMNGKLEITAD